MLRLALERQLTRRSLAQPFTRWYTAAQPKVSTEGEREIYQKLTEKFKPSELHVKDVSGGCGTFYSIDIVSTLFEGLSLVKQQRLVNETLKKEIQGIHGLQLRTMAPK